MTRILACAAVTSLMLMLDVGSPARASDQIVANCFNDAELRADLTAVEQSGGGTLTFSCNASTITLTSPLPDIAVTTKIDGGGKITLSGGNSFRLFNISGTGALELEDLVLTNGSSTGDGGAIFNFGSLVLRNVVVKNSVAAFSGGGLVTYGPVTIEGCTFASNRAAGGAAVYARFALSVVTITDSVLHDNETTLTSSGWGGAVLLWDGAAITIDGTHLYDNHGAQGGAVNNPFANSSVTIRNSLLERNQAGYNDISSGVARGGTVYSAGSLTIEKTAIVDSKSKNEGGGVYSAGGIVSIEDSILRGGLASEGGAIYGGGGSLTVKRSTIYDNDAAYGAGVSMNNVVATFENVTFASNDAFYSGGALYVGTSQVTVSNSTIHETHAGSGDMYVSPGATVSLRNTILSGSTGSNCFSTGGSIVSLDGNLSDDQSCSDVFTGLHDSNGPQYDPILVLSAIPGGSQLAYIPQPGSPAVDGGVASGAPLLDQRGVPRPQGIANDRGSVEVAACPDVVCGDATGDGKVAAADALLALRTAVGSADCPMWRCDFNGDDSVAASDALAILRTAVGQPTLPDCPDAWDCVPTSPQ